MSLEVLDWRRRVQQIYADVRAQWPEEPAEAHRRWQAARDELFATHSQSPLAPEARRRFGGLEYFPYDAALSFTAHIEQGEVEHLRLGTSTGAPMAFERFGRVHLPVGTLDIYWLDAYGGGLFVPFSDATAGNDTYGGGRYLLDTVKGADLGSTAGGALVFDFNFAYSPSCAYDAGWTCPLPRPGNRLHGSVEAGEKRYLELARDHAATPG